MKVTKEMRKSYLSQKGNEIGVARDDGCGTRGMDFLFEIISTLFTLLFHFISLQMPLTEFNQMDCGTNDRVRHSGI